MSTKTISRVAKPRGIRACLADLLAERVTPMDLVQKTLDSALAVNPEIRAFSAISGEMAIREAEKSARRYREGRARSLEGIPIAIKDLIDTEHLKTCYGSAAYRDHFPSGDAEIVRQLRDQGAIIIGKTTTHEFAWGVTTSSETFGDTLNPADLARIPGGSSGGAAASIAAGVVAAGIGTDTGGSVRIPAALCGTVGYKPTFGRLSTSGVFPFAPSLDHVGILGATVDDVVIVATAAGIAADDAEIQRVKVGVIREIAPVPVEESIAQSFDTAIQGMTSRHDVIDLSDGHPFQGVLEAFGGIVLTEASIGHHMRNSGDRIARYYGSETRDRLQKALPITVNDYVGWQDARRRFQSRLTDFMANVDYLVLPATPCIAPPLGATSATIRSWTGTLREALMTYAAPFNMAGFPAISIPLPAPSGSMPRGLQLVAHPGRDRALLAFARMLAGTFDHAPAHAPFLSLP